MRTEGEIFQKNTIYLAGKLKSIGISLDSHGDSANLMVGCKTACERPRKVLTVSGNSVGAGKNKRE